MWNRSVLVVAALAAVSGAAFAQGKMKPKPAAAPSCPACKMTLATAKSDKTPVGVAVGKKVYYCCSGCDMKDWKKDKAGNVIPPAAKK